jgi:hypothetical protein
MSLLFSEVVKTEKRVETIDEVCGSLQFRGKME